MPNPFTLCSPNQGKVTGDVELDCATFADETAGYENNRFDFTVGEEERWDETE